MGVLGLCPAIMLTLFVTCVGVIMGYLLYMNRQLTRLNDTVNTQQSVLATLITDIKASSMLGEQQCGASPIAMHVAKLATGTASNHSDKNSDSSDDDSSDDDSSDDGSDENITTPPMEGLDEDNAGEVSTAPSKDIIVEKLEDNKLPILFEQMDGPINPDTDNLVFMSGIHTVQMDTIGVEGIRDMMNSIKDVMVDNDEPVNSSNGGEYDIDDDEVTQQDISNMKVAELRTVVTDKIGHVANISKLKKNELLELLEKK